MTGRDRHENLPNPGLVNQIQSESFKLRCQKNRAATEATPNVVKSTESTKFTVLTLGVGVASARSAAVDSSFSLVFKMYTAILQG